MKKNHRIKFSSRPHKPLKEYSVQEFENLSGMIYLPALAFKSRKTYDRIKRLCAKSSVSERAKWLGAVYGKLIDQSFVNNVFIKWTGEEMEYGCYTAKNLKRDEYIGEFTGLVRPCTIFTRDLNDYCFRYPLYRTFFVVYTIDANMQGNEMSFINHSKKPNAEAVAIFHKGLYHIALRALTDISENDQLFFDYGSLKMENF